VLVFLLFVEHLMDESDDNRALPYRRRHTLHSAAPDVTDREHAGQTRFQEVGRPGERPTRGGHILRGQLRSSLDEPVRVERDTPLVQRTVIVGDYLSRGFIAADVSPPARREQASSCPWIAQESVERPALI
jgi:hypothetical protein